MKELSKNASAFLFGGYNKKGNRERVGGERKGFLLGKKRMKV